jgi:cobalamin biosynthesis protein CobD/CbiB
MKNAKPILAALAILLAALVVWFLVGVVVTIVKFLFVLALIVFGVSIFRKLSGKTGSRHLGERYDNRELNEATRQLEEIKRRQQLTK